MDRNNIYTFILLGDSQVGKTALLDKLCNYPTYTQSMYQPTIGIAHYSKRFNHDNKQCKLQYWDTSGDIRYRSLLYSYIPISDAILLLFDTTNRMSFVNLTHWIDLLENIQKKKVRSNIILVGTKYNKNYQNCKVTTLEATDLANKLGGTYVTCNTKNNELDELKSSFISLIDIISNKRETNREIIINKKRETNREVPKKNVKLESIYQRMRKYWKHMVYGKPKTPL